MNQKTDVIIVGGGLAGLTAAALLAQAGKHVTLFEKARQLGGRAQTEMRHRFAFNLGPHGLYRNGAGIQVLKQLGVTVKGKPPDVTGGLAMLNGLQETFPSGGLSLLATGLFPLRDKFEAARLLMRLPSISTAELQSVTVDQWLQTAVQSAAVRQFLRAFIRLTSYTNDPARQSAGAALEQVQLALTGGVLYLDDGWQTLVNSLRTAAQNAGAHLIAGQRCKAILVNNHKITGIQLANDETVMAPNVVLTSAPNEAHELLAPFASPTLLTALQATIPVKAACLDVALRRLPQPRVTFALGIDQPHYFSVHSMTAKLAPAQHALIHVAKYLNPNEPFEARAAETELELLLEQVQPGWRAELLDQRFLPNITVNHAMVAAADGGCAGRVPVQCEELRGLYLAGDWLGPTRQLADASFASAQKVAKLINS